MKNKIAAICFIATVAGACCVSEYIRSKKNKNIEKIQNDFMQEKNNILFGTVSAPGNSRYEIGVRTDGRNINSNVLAVGYVDVTHSHYHIASNLLQADTSAVVIDPNGWMAREYTEKLRKKGFDVYSCTDDANGKIILKTSGHGEIVSGTECIRQNLGCITRLIGERKGILFLSGENMQNLLSVVLDAVSSDKKEYICFYLDEFTGLFELYSELGIYFKIKDFMAKSETYHIGFHIIVQYIERLKKIYGKEYKEIISMCDTLLFADYNSENMKFMAEMTGTSDNILVDKNLVCIKGQKPVLCDKLNLHDYMKEIE